MNKRLLAFLIDYLIICAIVGTLGFLVMYINLSNGKIGNTKIFLYQYLTVILFGSILLFLKDVHNSSSIGKKIFKLKVVDINDSSIKINLFRHILRNIFLIIWPLEFVVLIGNSYQERIGDKLSKTKVISVNISDHNISQ